MLRKQASSNFDTYLAEVKNSKTGLGNKLPKERLTAEGWNELNRSLAAENVQMVDTGTGYMQFVRANHIDDIASAAQGKKGQQLVDVLKSRATNTGARIARADADGFIEFHYGEAQCATGLKFHVSVQQGDLERASLIVDDLVRNGDVADMWKVYASGMGGSQLGKDFTIYVSPQGYNQAKIQKFVTDLENALRNNNIKSNGFGANILSGDKKIAGSNYINYRYDRIDNLGRAQSGYNGAYNFVAPNAQYGGDIMNGIKVW